MTKKHSSIDQLSSASSRRAQSEAAMLQSDLKKLRTSLLNMDRGVRSPKIKAKRTWTKASYSIMSPLLRAQAQILGNLIGGAIKSEWGDDQTSSGSSGGSGSTDDTPAYLKSAYLSESQLAGSLLANLITGQRIR
ncbi:MAG: hypothetical protein WC521_02810 [Bdellovibrionales bacterium]